MIGRAIDRFIGVLAPAYGARRMAARATMDQIEAFSNGASGYDGGKLNRLSKTWSGGTLSENAIPAAQLDRLRARSWDLYRNNPHARKIVRTLEAKVVGCGMHPQSMATRVDGTPHVEFREMAKHLWMCVAKQMDYRGRPGKGGQDLGDLQRLALRSVILGGEVLYRVRSLSPREQKQLGLGLPIALQLIHAQRLASDLTNGGTSPAMYRGIELDADGRRAAYHLYSMQPSDPLNVNSVGETTRIPADKIGHLYVADDVDQLRGVPWFAPALMQMRDTGDYQFNELTASAMAACIVLGIKRPTGATSIGLNQPSDWDTTDADGNKLTALQPGMILNLGRDGEMQSFNPGRPSTNAEAWIQHMLRTTAASQPGVKSSTLTGDYRNSSFSSERSADNDAWPELETVQSWFSCGFVQPIYEQVIRAATLTGYFSGIVTEAEFSDREDDFLRCNWQGPVPLSINPTDDAKGARLRIQNGTSSPQIECSRVGRNYLDVLKDTKEFIDQCEALEIPPDLMQQFLGIDQLDSNQPGGTGENADDGAETEGALNVAA